ncbi:hypothetical protein AAV32_15105 [Kerstersia gyiorum]|uniref:Uncharacterized protein n=1 Tax=Kerstersia gyiorum TaxID=206506 RepID=A0A171KPI8_9BURK|nr:hypothetical protein AAV32_15105 [Kerstersia gyiorum]
MDGESAHLGQDVLAENPPHLRQGTLSPVLQFESAVRQPLLVDRFETVGLRQTNSLPFSFAVEPGIDALAEQGTDLVAQVSSIAQGYLRIGAQ